MDKRVEFHSVLVDILGSRNVYFDPPESIRLNYPAIVYSRRRIQLRRADDELYGSRVAYDVTVIDKNPDNTFVSALLNLPRCNYDRHHVVDNLHHDVFTIYY